MDDLVSILRKSVKALGAGPALLVAGLAAGVIALPALVMYGQFDETAKMVADNAQILLTILIVPFLTGGALGYAIEVRNRGSSGLATLIASGKKNYLRMLMAGIISFLAFNLLLPAAEVLSLVGIVIDPLIGLLLGVIILVLTFLAFLAIEFYDIGIVADNLDVMATFRNSIDFVKRNLGSAILVFSIILALKILVALPIMFGIAGTAMSNETYYNALINESLNFTAPNSTVPGVMASNSTLPNATALNATFLNSTFLNSTALLMTPPPEGPGTLAAVGIAQVLLQAFVFALVVLFKTEFYLTVKQRKRITDFDYDFSDEKDAPRK